MFVYHYDRDSRAYLGKEEARLDPLEKTLNDRDVYLFPAYSTMEEPPAVEDGSVAIWTDEGWTIEKIPDPVVTEPEVLTDQEEWELIRGSLPTEVAMVRRILYGSLRYRLVGDSLLGSLDLARPFPDRMTVDEMSQGYLNYIGDDTVKAEAYLEKKRQMKAYIRSVSGNGGL